MGAWPTGTVSFLMSDAEASSALWRRDGSVADEVFRRLDTVVDRAVVTAHGVVVLARGEGDSHVAAFERASDAVVAAVALQRAIASTTWPGGTPVAVRIGVHTGEPIERDDNYFGDVLNESARLRSLGHGGQVLVSTVSAALARSRLPSDIGFRSLGIVRIRDFRQPHEVFQVIAPDLANDFPPLRALDSTPPAISVILRVGFSTTRPVVEDATYAEVVTDEERLARFVRRCFDECGGHGLNIDGSGIMAAFATPMAALEFFTRLRAPLRPHGYDIHAGLHVGPIEMTARGPSGPALVVAAHLLRMAQPGEILVSRTIRDLLPHDVRSEPHPGPLPRVLGTTWDVHRLEQPEDRG